MPRLTTSTVSDGRTSLSASATSRENIAFGGYGNPAVDDSPSAKMRKRVAGFFGEENVVRWRRRELFVWKEAGCDLLTQPGDTCPANRLRARTGVYRGRNARGEATPRGRQAAGRGIRTVTAMKRARLAGVSGRGASFFFFACAASAAFWRRLPMKRSYAPCSPHTRHP
jgi:hypothetical protein